MVSYSMGKKLSVGGIGDSPYKNKVPGPGVYEPKHTMESRFRSDGFTRFGTSKRAGFYNKSNSPSPDNYKQDAQAI